MENNIYNFQQTTTNSGTMAKTFVANVFAWMAVALGISGGIAYLFGTDPSLMLYLINQATGGLNVLGYVVMFAPLALVLIMSMALNKLSYTVLVSLFLVYAVVTGLSLSFIFLAYTSASIFQVFLGTAAMFAVMAVLGYTTKTDLTKFGSLMMMALVGIIVASLINFFIHSSGLGYIISIIGVIVFTGLTAYDVQKIKNFGAQATAGTETTAKMTIMGALSLYLDFINLFLMLLRLFGDRRN